MKAELEVAHNGEFIGHLVEEVGGDWAFVYAPDFVQSGSTSRLLSLNFPPRGSAYRGDDLAAVFRNLLPDGDIRRQLARRIGVSEGNDFSLLAAVAGDCPGALTLAPPGERRFTESEVRRLTEQDLRNVLAALPLHPLLIEVEGARFTLPGEHHKIAVRVVAEQIALTLGSTLSSHIVKPAKSGLRESVMNEGYCLELARELDLPAVEAAVRHGAVTVLLVARLDREQRNGEWRAIHMEDFCQLYGVPPGQKYEREGGLGAVDCINIIKRYSAMPAVDMRSFLRWLMFCYLIGDGDAQAKQLAIRHLPDGPRLAPFFGLMSTHVYPTLNHQMAMSIGGEDRPDWITPSRWREFAGQAGIKGAYVLSLLRDLAERVPQTGALVAERFQRRHGFASVIRDIRGRIEQRARQVLVSLQAETL
jgi:serine/threonine-protein kinase HipA